MNTITVSDVAINNGRVQLNSIPAAKVAAERPENHVVIDEEAQSPLPNRSRRQQFKRAAFIALIVITGIGVTKLTYNWWTVGRFIESTDDAYVGGDVTVIAPEVAGFIAQVAVTDNQ